MIRVADSDAGDHDQIANSKDYGDDQSVHDQGERSGESDSNDSGEVGYYDNDGVASDSFDGSDVSGFDSF